MFSNASSNQRWAGAPSDARARARAEGHERVARPVRVEEAGGVRGQREEFRSELSELKAKETEKMKHQEQVKILANSQKVCFWSCVLKFLGEGF